MKNIVLMIALGLSTAVMANEGGDPIAGKQKAILCSACHQTDGNSLVPNFPKLAGQNTAYTVKQLKDFKAAALDPSQGRTDVMMAPLTLALSEQDMHDIAAYYASQTAIVAEVNLAAGIADKLYRSGDRAKGLVACTACHGALGKGIASAAYPGVSGQHKAYLVKQLTAFKSGERNNDVNQIMQQIASKLSASDIEALAEYMAVLH